MAQQAQDTFTAQLKDGSSLLVTKGSTWPDNHEVVRLDEGRELLFKRLDYGEEAPAPAQKTPAPAPAAERKAPAAAKRSATAKKA